MLTTEEKKQQKNARERARWQKARDEKLIAMGIDPATRPMSKDGSRGKAIGPCKRDLPADIKYPKDGETEEEFKKRYQSEVKKLYYARNTERLRAEKREKHWANRDAELERARIWRINNPESHKASQKRYYEANKEKRALNSANWILANPERRKQIMKEWYDANPHINSFYSSRYRATERNQTPPWADAKKIKNIFKKCYDLNEISDIQHHVDHIVPLRGKTVCGLHIHQNLRIIPGVENVKKRNRLDESLVIALMKLDWEKITN